MPTVQQLLGARAIDHHDIAIDASVDRGVTDAVPDPLADAKRQLGYGTAPGSSECLPAWRGLTPLSMNPHYGQVREQEKMMPAGIMDDVQWTHYDDLKNIYGVDADGQARVMWDNVGVQYGLRALVEGLITPAEFLDLNAKVGGWKHPRDMVQELMASGEVRLEAL